MGTCDHERWDVFLIAYAKARITALAGAFGIALDLAAILNACGQQQPGEVILVTSDLPFLSCHIPCQGAFILYLQL